MSKPKFKVGDKVYTLYEYGVPTIGVVMEVHKPIVSDEGYEFESWTYRIEGVEKDYPFSVITDEGGFYNDIDEFVEKTTEELKRFAEEIKEGNR